MTPQYTRIPTDTLQKISSLDLHDSLWGSSEGQLVSVIGSYLGKICPRVLSVLASLASKPWTEVLGDGKDCFDSRGIGSSSSDGWPSSLSLHEDLESEIVSLWIPEPSLRSSKGVWKLCLGCLLPDEDLPAPCLHHGFPNYLPLYYHPLKFPLNHIYLALTKGWGFFLGIFLFFWVFFGFSWGVTFSMSWKNSQQSVSQSVSQVFSQSTCHFATQPASKQSVSQSVKCHRASQQSVSQSARQPASQPASQQSVSQSTGHSATEPASSQSVSQPVTPPRSQPVSQSVSQSKGHPATRQASKQSVSQPTSQRGTLVSPAQLCFTLRGSRLKSTA